MKVWDLNYYDDDEDEPITIAVFTALDNAKLFGEKWVNLQSTKLTEWELTDTDLYLMEYKGGDLWINKMELDPAFEDEFPEISVSSR